MSVLDAFDDDAEGGRPSSPVSSGGKQVSSPRPPPGAQLSSRERKVWDYICGCLRAEGLSHMTAGIAITVVCKTFIRWINTEMQLQEFEAGNNNSYFVKTPNGLDQPHQLFYASNKLRKELLTCLPDSCLTLPSSVMARAKSGDGGLQDDLFDALQDHAAVPRESYSQTSH